MLVCSARSVPVSAWRDRAKRTCSGATTVADRTLFQSGWFVFGVLTQTLVVTPDPLPPLIPFVESRAANPLLLMTLAITAVGSFSCRWVRWHHISAQTLPPAYFWMAAAALLRGYCRRTHAGHGPGYRRRYGWI